MTTRSRGMADEAQPGKHQPETCARCGKTILRITGTLAAWWVHDPGGHTMCDPQQAASSPRATPQTADEAQPISEAEAAATLARECTDYAAVVLWCADRVRSVDDDPAVQDAADHLHDLSVRARADMTPIMHWDGPDRPNIIRWCAQDIHSMGGNHNVERAAEYLDDLATEAADRATEK